MCYPFLCSLRSLPRLSDLTIVLYLLGFSGSDVRGLRKRRWFDGDGPGGAAPAAAENSAPKESSKRVMVQGGHSP